MVLPIDSANFARTLRLTYTPNTTQSSSAITPSVVPNINPFISETTSFTQDSDNTELFSQVINTSNIATSSNIISQQASALGFQSDIVSGSELANALKEIDKVNTTFTNSVTSKNLSTDNNAVTFKNVQTYDNGLSIAGSASKIDFETAKSIAAQKASFNFDVSDKTKEIVNKMTLQQIQVQTAPPVPVNITRVMDGMIPFAPVPVAQTPTNNENLTTGKNLFQIITEVVKNAQFDPNQSTSNPFLSGGDSDNFENSEGNRQKKHKDKGFS